MKHLSLIFFLLILSAIGYAQTPAPIVGLSGVCVGTTSAYTDATPGGTWSCVSTSIATIDATGTLTAVSPGMVTVTYDIGTGFDTIMVTIVPPPCPTVGPSAVCVGATVTETDCSPGGIWSITPTSLATVSFSTGIVTGVGAGVAALTYTMAPGCMAVKTVTVLATPTAISGPSVVCVGSIVTFTDATPGGSWTSDNTAVVTVGMSTGIAGGASVGTANIFYTISSGCGVSKTLTVVATPSAYTVTGGGSFCAGGAGVHIGLSGSGIGVSYQVYLAGTPVGSLVPGTGGALDLGLFTTPGVYTVTGAVGTTCSATMSGSVTVSSAPAPTVYAIMGGGTYCSGTSVDIVLVNSDAGVSYQLYLGATAVGGPVAGTGAAIDFGTVTSAGTYSIIGTNMTTLCVSTMGPITITFSALPAAFTVTGGGTYCSGGSGLSVGLTGSAVGVNYELYLDGTATGTTLTGTGTALDFGSQTAAGVYTVLATNTSGCAATMTGGVTITVVTSVTPSVVMSMVTPGTTVCTGTAVSFTITTTGGGTTPTYLWTVNGTSVATGATYTYVPTDGDAVTVTLTSSATCASPTTSMDSVIMTVVAPPTVSVTASGVACDGSYTLTASGASTYSWTPGSYLSCTTCSAPTSNPAMTTTYAVTGTDGYGCSGSASVTVDGNRIRGAITPGVTGTVKVWLVQFNPTDSSIAALDSTTACTSGGSQYYEFADPVSGDYMVKAYLLGQTPGASGYIPTYGASSAHWYSASTVSHTGATDNMNINMIYGTVPSGPGFISGYIASGAGKGTSGSIPVDGMLVLLMDGSGNVLTHTFTSGGNYSFGSLGYGDYIVYPEDYDYGTTPSAVVSLGSGHESATNVNFKQHTGSKTITPNDYTAVKQLSGQSGIVVYPNPASGTLFVSWTNQAVGDAQVTFTDVVGREVYSTPIAIKTAGGQAQVSLDGIAKGVYLLAVKGDNVYYTAKLVIE